jgi:hypothetical protein
MGGSADASPPPHPAPTLEQHAADCLTLPEKLFNRKKKEINRQILSIKK